VRVGLLDIAAAGALVIAIVMPAPGRPVKSLYAGPTAGLASKIARTQADIARDPSDAAAAAQLADLLVRAHQTDFAIRVAGRAAASSSPEKWRAIVAVSAAHVERYEIGLGLAWAQKALAACDDAGADCPDFERGRLQMYATALESAQKSGIDPRVNPTGVGEAVESAVPLIRVGKPKRP
jgi:hypothetical protein